MQKDQRKAMEDMLKSAGLGDLIKLIDSLDKKTREAMIDALSKELNEQRKRDVVRIVSDQVKMTDAELRQWLQTSVPKAYINGLNAAEDQLATFRINTGFNSRITFDILKSSPLLAPHLVAVNAILSDAYLDFGNTMNGVIRGSEHILNDALKRQTRLLIAQGRLEGEGVREVAKEVRELIGKQGFSVLLDRGGRQWSLPRYSEMLTRTHLIRANNEAIINRANDFDIDLVEVSTHASACPICQPFEGKVYSRSGNSKKYPKLRQEPPFHPNCKHRLLMRPDLRES